MTVKYIKAWPIKCEKGGLFFLIDTDKEWHFSLSSNPFHLLSSFLSLSLCKLLCDHKESLSLCRASEIYRGFLCHVVPQRLTLCSGLKRVRSFRHFTLDFEINRVYVYKMFYIRDHRVGTQVKVVVAIQICTIASKINVTTKGIRLSEKLQLTAALYNEI